MLKDVSAHYSDLAERIKSATYKACYDDGRGLMADSPEKDTYSQHANILAILTNTLPVDLQKTVMEKIITEVDIAACTFYFRFYGRCILGNAQFRVYQQTTSHRSIRQNNRIE